MTASLLDELLGKLDGLPKDQFAQVQQLVSEQTNERPWFPSPGPQTEAYFSKADLLLYGGQGGGGKTDLLVGLALCEHQRTLVLRPQYTDLGNIIERLVKVAGTRQGLNRAPPPKFDTADGRRIDFGAASTLEQAETWQGNPHDLIAFDEACQFREDVVQFLMGWNRAADDDLDAAAKQRTRIVFASNPPMGAEGEWIIRWFAPWLDPAHGNPAKPGELRWFITNPHGEQIEVDGSAIITIEGREFRPRSRTYIPASLDDNPFLRNTDYRATLDALPEPMRSAIRDGNFMAAREDDAMQVIPTDWVIKAFDRWREWQTKEHHTRPDVAVPMSSLGCDVARGGRDNTVLAPRWGSYLGELVVVPGRDTPDGPSVAALCASRLRDGAVVGVDSIGVGADAETSLRNAGLPYEAMNGAEKSYGSTRDGSYLFQTRRSEMWWMLREALDPINGAGVALPPDNALQADLTAPLWEVRPGMPPKIYVEAKKDMMKRLGRSPDRGDAVVYAWNSGGLDIGKATGNRHQRARHAPPAASDYDPFNF